MTNTQRKEIFRDYIDQWRRRASDLRLPSSSRPDIFSDLYDFEQSALELSARADFAADVLSELYDLIF